MKLKTVVDSIQALHYLINQPIKVDLAFQLSKTWEVAQERFQSFEKRRQEIIKSRAVGDTIPEDKIKEATEEITKILDEETEVPIPEMTTRCIDGIKIPPAHLVSLRWLIER